MELVGADLSEPYSTFTYRHFLQSWPDLCILATSGGKVVAVAISKVEDGQRGYIAMLAVRRSHRNAGIGIEAIERTIRTMRDTYHCDEVVLEAEASNAPALGLYNKLGFLREDRLVRYYLNGADALRLSLRLS